MTQTADEARVQFAGGTVSTPSLRSTARRLVYWVVIAIIVVAFALVMLALTGTSPDKAKLSGNNPGQKGAAALIAVLRQDGVHVDLPTTITAAERDAAADPSNTSVVLYDEHSVLDQSQLKELFAASKRIILIDPGAVALRALMPGTARIAANASTPRAAACALPGARGAVSATGFDHLYRVSAGATGCFPTGSAYGLVHVTERGRSISLIGATETFTNGAILQKGNAALALGQFGQTRHLVWYLPSAADANGTVGTPIPVPPWVTPVIVLAGLVLLAAGIWRGRRFGPVVIERMPVFVRASETLEGRARLYQKASDRTHAIDSLRMGAIGRISTAVGLSVRASVEDVIGAAASLTGMDPADVRRIVLDALPRNDTELLRLSDELADLETTVAKAVRAR